MTEFKVELIRCTQDPQTLSTAGALGCFEEDSSSQILNGLFALPEEERLKKERGVLKNSFGRGHGSVGDQNAFVFSIEDLPRAATFQLCLPEYLSHLQQSLRRAKADRGFYLPPAIKNSSLKVQAQETLSRSFELYEKMMSAGIPGEDARFLLPLYTKTNIQTITDARELCHLWQMSQREQVPSIVRAVVDEMLSQAKTEAPFLFENFGFNYQTTSWFPSAQLYSPANKMVNKLINWTDGKDVVRLNYNLSHSIIMREVITPAMVQRAVKGDETELANLKGVHFEFLVEMSLTCLHQAIRQRTWDHRLESIYDAALAAGTSALWKDKRMVIPSSVKNSDFNSIYQQQHKDMLHLYLEMLKTGIPANEAIGVIPHSVKIYTLIHINGWNAIHAIGIRTCLEAQWEIRQIAWQIARIIKKDLPALGEWCKPQCIVLGKCPETKDCGYYKKKNK